MMRLLRRSHEDERGVALVTAALVAVVVMFLGATAMSISIHNSDAAGRNRRRVQAIGAAEAGLDWYFSHLQTTELNSIDCDGHTQNLTTTPASTFTTVPTFYDASGAQITSCPMTTVPDSVLISSEGRVVGQQPIRTMEAYVYLIPGAPTGFGDSAIFSEGQAYFDSNADVTNGTSGTADVYVNDDVELNSNVTVDGSVYTQGDFYMDSNAEVKRDVVANGPLVTKSNTVIRGNGRSATSYINTVRIYGDAQAGTYINGTVHGTKTPYTPSDPPPMRTFPSFTFNAADWTAQGYSVHTYSSCSDARSFINGITSGKRVVRITSSCTLSWTSGGPTVRDDLAIISNGGLFVDSDAKFKIGTGGPFNLHLFFGYGGSFGCSNGIELNSNAEIVSGLHTLLWTPCEVYVDSNAKVHQGQVFGGTTHFNSNSGLTFELIEIPGLSSAGFDEDIAFIREVITD